MLVLDYHQLVALSRHGSNPHQRNNGALLSVQEPGDDGRAEPDWGVADSCMEAMGPNGDGFVAVRGMRDYASLRSRLLRLAQTLALMPTSERAAVLKVIYRVKTFSQLELYEYLPLSLTEIGILSGF